MKIPDGKPFTGIVNGYNKRSSFIELRIDDDRYPHMIDFHGDGILYNVEFLDANRYPYQLQHNALHWFGIHGLFDVLLNNTEYENSFTLHEALHIVSSNVIPDSRSNVYDLNIEQSQAVRSILDEPVSIPFLLFGPPGEFLDS